MYSTVFDSPQLHWVAYSGIPSTEPQFYVSAASLFQEAQPLRSRLYFQISVQHDDDVRRRRHDVVTTTWGRRTTT